MKRLTAVAASLALTFAGCASMSRPATTDTAATAELRNADGQPAGTAMLTQVPGGVRIVIDVKGLPPGPHGVHVHEVGKCDGNQVEIRHGLKEGDEVVLPKK